MKEKVSVDMKGNIYLRVYAQVCLYRVCAYEGYSKREEIHV